MSKTIDKSDLSALDEDDLYYLHSHCEISTEQLAEALGVDVAAVTEGLAALHTPLPVSEQANTGDANTRGLSKEAHEAKVKAMAAEQGGDEADEDVDYVNDLNNDERRAELSRRGLPVDGNKQELISRLRQSDRDSGKELEYDPEFDPEEYAPEE